MFVQTLNHALMYVYTMTALLKHSGSRSLQSIQTKIKMPTESSDLLTMFMKDNETCNIYHAPA